jgi:hypothetical protein
VIKSCFYTTLASTLGTSHNHRKYRVKPSYNPFCNTIFYCNLAVTAKENGIDAICTENVNDFKGYSFVKTWNPFEK